MQEGVRMSARSEARAEARAKKKEKGSRYFDYNLLFLLIFIMCFGLVMLYSSSSYTSASKYGDSAHYLKLQIRNILIGLAPMLLFTFVDYRFWKRFSLWIYLAAFALCALVFVPGLGDTSNGSTRWLKLGPVSIQPSEIAKMAVIIFMAALLERIPKTIGTWKGLIKTFLFLLPIVGIIATQNLSTAVIVMAIAVCMIFVASPKYLQFIGVGAAGAAFLVYFLVTAGYRSSRIDAWLHPETADNGYQILQGLYAVGSGGLFGKGLGASIQKMGNVPEAQNDMIFTIICEELGLVGAICVIFMYVLLLWRMMYIAVNAADMYGALIVTGVMAHIGIQVVLNIAVATNSMPNTGVTLPFISYGGTSILFLMSEMGLVLSVSRGIRLKSVALEDSLQGRDRSYEEEEDSYSYMGRSRRQSNKHNR